MSVISRLKVWLGADTKPLEDSLKKGKREVNNFASGLKKLWKGIAGAVVVKEIFSFAKECIGLAKVQATAEKKLEAAVKATGGAAGFTSKELKKYASQLQDATTYGDEVTIGAMAIMSTFKSIKGDIFKEAIASAQDMATILNTDLNAAVLQIGKALEAPESGLTALRRSGVSFSQAQIKQIKQLVSEGKKQEAQLIMLKELQNEFGGAAKHAASDAYGATEQLSNSWGDFKEAMGNALTPGPGLMKAVTKELNKTTAVINDKSIPTWRKLLGVIVPVVHTLNQSAAGATEQKEADNAKKIKDYELQYKSLIELYDIQEDYFRMSKAMQVYYSAAYTAIAAEIKKREDGVEALDKEKERLKQLAAERKAEKEKRRAEEESVKLMSEKTAEAINKKIKAYKELAETADINDVASEAFFKKEMFRLQQLIERQKAMVSSRLLPELKKKEGRPIKKPKEIFGIREAAIDVETEILPDFKGVDQMTLLPDKLQKTGKALKDIKYDFIDLSDVANNAINDMCTGFAEGISELISGSGNLQGFAVLIAGTFADMAINVGKTAIQTGIAVEGIRLALKSLNPFVAIAAGAALIALGMAVKKSLGNIASGGSGGTFSSSAISGNSITDTRQGRGVENAAKPMEVVVRGDFKLKGSTLVAAVESEGARKYVTT